MLTLTTTIDAAVEFQPDQSLLELIIIWYLLTQLNADARRLRTRWITRQKRSCDGKCATREKRRKRRPRRRACLLANCR